MKNLEKLVDKDKSLFDLMNIDLSAETCKERFQQYLEQVGDPYYFKVDDITVKLEFSKDAENNFSSSLASVLNCG